MILTNKYKIHPTVVEAVKNLDTHVTYGDISVTQLIDSPQIWALKQSNEIEKDVSDMLWATMGTAMHKVLELGVFKDSRIRKLIGAMEAIIDMKKTSKSEQFTQDVDSIFEQLKALLLKYFDKHLGREILYEQTHIIDFNGVKISGTLDYYNKITQEQNDYKMCSVYAYIFPESRLSWEKQQNIYAYMLRMNGYKVKKINIIAIFRDWSQTKANLTKDYPKRQCMTIAIPIWSDEKCEQYLISRLKEHKKASQGDMKCTPEEMWEKSGTWAVMVKNKVRAHRVYSDQKSAEQEMDVQMLKNPKIQYYIEERPGERKRCADYCEVSNFCSQYAEYLKNREK